VTDSTNQTVLLQDGRKLGYAEYGVQDGTPVFHFHGSSSSRLDRPVEESVLLEAGCRLVVADRPGHGLSDPQVDRRLLDWPDDVSQLADHLGIEAFHVTGYSAGGPHALVCAYKLPERVIAAAAVSSLAPMGRRGAFRGMPLPNQILNGSARWAPWLAKLIRRMMSKMLMGDVEQASRRLLTSLPEADQRVLYVPEQMDAAAEGVREALRQGWRGVAQDDIIVFHDWGFDPAQIRVRVDIWHGTADVNVPYHAGQYLHDTIPDSRATFLPGEGHFLLMVRWGEILTALTSER
jgi:pimeloyl-ACP methyl ester carboxylesterase